MLRNITYTIPDSAHGTRLDRILLERHPSTTRALLNLAFRESKVLVNGRPAAKSDKPAPGTTITISELMEQRDKTVIPVRGEADIVYEDEYLAAVNKPRGQPCHPVKPGETDTLANILAARYGEITDIGGDPLMPGLIHRIDAGTSGLVLVARSGESFGFIRKQFTARTVKKTYLAAVHGKINSPGGVSGMLAHCSSFRGRMRVVSGAKLPKGEKPMFAETFYKPIAFGNGQTLLEVTIYTGVTHQIRCQLASIGHPVVGDAAYGSPAALPLRHHLLHSFSAQFIHPETKTPITIRAALPEVMAKFGFSGE